MPNPNVYDSTVPCKRGHIGLRYAASRACVECSKERARTPQGKLRHAAHNKRRYAEIKDDRLAQQKEYRATLRGRAFKMLQSVNIRSKRRGEDGTITVEWVIGKLANERCEVSGIVFDLSKDSRRSPYAPSIDRIDNSKWYTPDNCRVILWALNAAFSHWGQAEFAKIARIWLSSCSGCGASHDRDVNAARNILRVGLERQAPAGEISVL